MKTYTFDFFYRIKYYETDKMGYVHNSNYFRLFEIGREETMRHCGLSYDDIEKKGIMMPLIEQFARYHVPAHYDDNVIIRTTVMGMPQAKIEFHYEVLSIKNDKEILHCKGWNKLCFVDEKTRKPMRCPNFLMDILQKFLTE